MAIVSENELRAKISTSADTRALKTAEQKFSSFSKRVGDVSRKMKDTGKAMTTRLTLPIMGLGAAILKTAADFETGMNRVQALSGATAEQFQALRTQAKDLGRTTQFSASQAADAMGFLAMAGFEADQVLGAMPSTLQLAASAQLDLASAADITSNILTGYGLKVEDLGHVNDVLVKSFTSANTNLVQLGEAMKFAGPVASAAGIRFEESAAALALMGNAGIQATMAGTSLRGAITRLLNPTDAISEVLDKYNITVMNADGNMKSLAEILRQFETAGLSNVAVTQKMSETFSAAGVNIAATQEPVKTLGDLFRLAGEQGIDMTESMGELGSESVAIGDLMEVFGLRAGPAMAGLISQGTDALVDLEKELNNAGGIAEEIGSVQMKGLNGAMKALKSAAEGLAIAIADSGLLDGATKLIQKFGEWTRKAAELNPEIFKMGVIIAGLTAVIGPLLWITSTLITPWGLLIGIVAALAHRFVDWQKVGEKLGPVYQTLKNIIQDFSGAMDVVNQVLETGGVRLDGLQDQQKEFEGKWSLLIGVVTRFKDAINKVIDVFNKWKPVILAGIDAVKALWEEIKIAFSAIWEHIKFVVESVKEAMIPLWKDLKDAMQPMMPFLKELGKVFAIGLVGAIMAVITIIGSLFKAAITIFTGIIQVISGAVQSIQGSFKMIIGIFHAFMYGDLELFKEGWRDFWSGVAESFQGGARIIHGILGALFGWIIDIFRRLYDILVGNSIIPDMINEIVDWFKGLPGKIAAGLKGIWGAVTQPFEDAFGHVKNLISDVGGKLSGLGAKAKGAIGKIPGLGAITQFFGNNNEGGSYRVGGRPGIDKNLVAFNATRGERVDIIPKGQAGRGRGETVINQTNHVYNQMDMEASIRKLGYELSLGS